MIRYAPLTRRALTILALAQMTFAVHGCRSDGPSVCACEPDIDFVPDPLADDPHHDGLTYEKRNAFISRIVGSTVTVYVARYSEKEGMTPGGGTGFVIEGGRILTAYHVIDGHEVVQVGFRKVADSGYDTEEIRYVPVIVEITAPESDVAILLPKYDERMPPALPLDTAWTHRRSELLWQFGKTTLWARGYPLDSSSTCGGKKTPVRHAEMVADYGDSGAPVLTSDGAVIGVVLCVNKCTKKQTYFITIAEAMTGLGLQ